LTDALSPAKWQEVEKSVDRGLAWIATQQAADGSFHTIPSGQPGVTGLCVLAFLSRGHQPGLGPYGAQLNKAVDFVLSCQMTNGLFSFETPELVHMDKAASHTASYNHAIAGLMLCEVYGHVIGRREAQVKDGITRALQFTRELQARPKVNPSDVGGWRYLRLRQEPQPPDSDLSVTAWQLMFLRSAKNAEFNVPQPFVDRAIEYVRRCWDGQRGMFSYVIYDETGTASSRGMTGAGVLCLSLAGQHDTPIARQAGNWLLAHPFRDYTEMFGAYDRFFYSAYYCSQAAAQLGGRYWEGIYPPLVASLLKCQASDGSWPEEPGRGDGVFGGVYTSALSVLALTPPYQLLPIYQR